MKKITFVSLLIMIFAGPGYAELTQQQLHDVLELRIQAIKHVSQTQMLMDATRKQNESALSTEDILDIDKAWRADTSPKIEEIEHSRASLYLKSIVKRMSNTYSEAFVTDKLGANVAMYPRTSDYWQGDEDAFLKAYNEGKGDVYVSQPEHDASTGSDEVKVAVPMFDEDQVIGVMVMAVKVSAIEAQRIRDLKSAK